MILENHGKSPSSVFNRKYVFKSWIFHCHVPFLGGGVIPFLGQRPQSSQPYCAPLVPSKKTTVTMSCPNCTNLTMLIFKGDLWNLLFQGSIFQMFKHLFSVTVPPWNPCMHLAGRGTSRHEGLSSFAKFWWDIPPFFASYLCQPTPQDKKYPTFHHHPPKKCTPKLPMTMENPPFEHAFPIWTWRFSSVILVSQGCYPTGSSSIPPKKKSNGKRHLRQLGGLWCHVQGYQCLTEIPQSLHLPTWATRVKLG